ncbi:Uncharacterised protein [Acholeplasma oculi]|uniref:Uncharacterized protein n=1 Tax=Acholeplasma oculi TaxID=35623 RepID=A0A061AAM4_9MOLU|nr:hypothetical protein [Acholeplasma oculi]CDR30950.1 hypothetical protein Aocu_08770 [Acholeplasma oculi]SKC35715.1 hypothetical protein SAMN02745122_0300 [Acholeplasma oculi]SUT90256.1 Uncharacterised protein [Acholeplasma oculi]
MNNIDQIKNALSVIKEAKITRISYAADLIMLTFTKDDIEFHIHSQTLVRFIENNHILFTRTDYFNKEDYSDENNLGTNLYVKIDMYGNKFDNKKVLSLFINDLGDIDIILEDDLKIQIIIDSSADSYGYGNEH